jgi:hypothetical protein
MTKNFIPRNDSTINLESLNKNYKGLKLIRHSDFCNPFLLCPVAAQSGSRELLNLFDLYSYERELVDYLLIDMEIQNSRDKYLEINIDRGSLPDFFQNNFKYLTNLIGAGHSFIPEEIASSIFLLQLITPNLIIPKRIEQLIHEVSSLFNSIYEAVDKDLILPEYNIGKLDLDDKKVAIPKIANYKGIGEIIIKEINKKTGLNFKCLSEIEDELILNSFVNIELPIVVPYFCDKFKKHKDSTFAYNGCNELFIKSFIGNDLTKKGQNEKCALFNTLNPQKKPSLTDTESLKAFYALNFYDEDEKQKEIENVITEINKSLKYKHEDNELYLKRLHEILTNSLNLDYFKQSFATMGREDEDDYGDFCPDEIYSAIIDNDYGCFFGDYGSFISDSAVHSFDLITEKEDIRSLILQDYDGLLQRLLEKPHILNKCTTLNDVYAEENEKFGNKLYTKSIHSLMSLFTPEELNEKLKEDKDSILKMRITIGDLKKLVAINSKLLSGKPLFDINNFYVFIP